MTVNRKQFVIDPERLFEKVNLSPNSGDGFLIVEALKKRFSKERSWLTNVLHPFTEKYSQFTLHSIHKIESGGFELRLYNGGRSYDSTTYVRVYPGRKWGLFGKRIFEIRLVSTETS